MKQDSNSHLGLLATISAFLLWGILPTYWKALEGVPAAEILCHRIIWCVPFIGLVLTLTGRWSEVLDALKNPRTSLLLAFSSLLTGVNWFTYIWGVNTNHLIEASLGYYINPLASMFLGYIFFKDRLNKMQSVAICFALCGVLLEVWHFGRLPWIALVLTLTFSLYGLIRKIAAVESLPGLFIETLALSIPAIAYLLKLEVQGAAYFGHTELSLNILLIGSGIATTLPLAAYAFGARRLRLMTVGIIQYIGPSGIFLLGVFAYHEPFSASRLGTFALIWTGVVIYTLDSAKSYIVSRRIEAQTT